MKKAIILLMFLVTFSVPFGVALSVDDGDIGQPKEIIVLDLFDK